MNKRVLAANLAASLARARWTAHDIVAVLERRFPQGLRGKANELAVALIEACPSAYAPVQSRIVRLLLEIESFDKVHATCARLQVWPDPDLSSAQLTPIAAFEKLDLPVLTTVADLAEWLGLTPERLSYFGDPEARFESHGDAAVNHYHYHLLSKPSGGCRVIEAPKPVLKALQRRVLGDILSKVPVHENAFGFVQGRNCQMAAQRHAGEGVVVSFDLARFFPSIRYDRIFGLFRALGYPQRVARILAGLCTNRTPERVLGRLQPPERDVYRSLHLPQGAPTSPALANLASYRLDRRLSGLARRLGANFTRYADDFTFSGDSWIAAPLLKMAPGIVRDEGFVLNPTKTRVMRKSGRQSVTGIVVNQHVNVARPDYDQLRAVLHACKRADDQRLRDPRFVAHIQGKIGWVEALNPRRGLKLWHMLELAVAAHGVDAV